MAYSPTRSTYFQGTPGGLLIGGVVPEHCQINPAQVIAS